MKRRLFGVRVGLAVVVGLLILAASGALFAADGDLYVNGKVGVGTVNPGAKLDVFSGSISSDTQIGRFDAPGSATGVGYVTFGLGFVGWDYATGGLGVNAHSAGGSSGGIFVKRVDNSHSNVGIGTTNPRGTLDVIGTTYCTYGYWSGSDLKLKENVKPVEKALDQLVKLQGVSYEWKSDGSKEKKINGRRHHGVIAQDVEKVFPDMVMNGPDGEKAVEYNQFIPILIEAVKEQQKKIGELEGKIKQLEMRSE